MQMKNTLQTIIIIIGLMFYFHKNGQLFKDILHKKYGKEFYIMIT